MAFGNDRTITSEEWAKQNTFLDTVAEQEISFFGNPTSITEMVVQKPFSTDLSTSSLSPQRKDVSHHKVKVGSQQIQGRCEDYLNKNFRMSSPPIPTLWIDGKLWMSLSFMEVQSQFLSIQFARGKVVTAGLGLGHFVLRCMQKDEVTHIEVFEVSPVVISLFCETFKGRPGFDKVSFVQGDARETFIGRRVDFAYVDIYQTLLPDDVISDIEIFNQRNEVGFYHFWGRERWILDGVNRGVLSMSDVDSETCRYFGKWLSTPMSDGGDTKMSDLYQGLVGEGFVVRILEAYDDLGISPWHTPH
jgi:hypothetical protein